MLDNTNFQKKTPAAAAENAEQKKKFSNYENMKSQTQTNNEKKEMTLADLPVGASATIVKIIPNSRGEKKFSDVGLVAGTELIMQAHAPFGGLLRVKVMQTSMALHSADAKNIILKRS